MIAMTSILVWGAYCGAAEPGLAVSAVLSILLAGGFVYENRQLLPDRQTEPLVRGRPSLLRRLTVDLGPAATALFLGLCAISAECVPMLLMHWFHPH